MSKIIIKIENVSMKYRIYKEKIEYLKEYVLKSLKNEIKFSKIKALDSINLEIIRGDRIGIIGQNGAGKSTLLKLISGVMKPSEGTVTVSGSVAPLLELGAGFDFDFSGEDNIYLNGAILGKDKQFMEKHYNEIVEYSELDGFIKVAIKNYSSGMKMKLGFSIVAFINADILVLDEILGVGDVRFKKKSSKTIEEKIKSGATTIIVSHDLNRIKRLTEKVIWLHKGKIKMIGPTKKVVKEYLSFFE